MFRNHSCLQNKVVGVVKFPYIINDLYDLVCGGKTWMCLNTQHVESEYAPLPVV